MAVKILLSGRVGSDINVEMLKPLLEEANGEDIEFDITSGGGSVFQGIAVSNLIRRYEGKTTSNILGLAASMATYIALAADERRAEDDAVFMIHNPSGMVYGDQNDMAKMARTLESIANLIASRYAAVSGRKIGDIRAEMDAETFFFGNEIKKAGFVDSISKGKGKDKKAALDEAELEILAVMESMEKEKIEPEKIAAEMKGIKPDAGAGAKEPPGKPKQRESVNNPNNSEGEKTMDWEEFFKTPEAKAKLNALLKEAGDKGNDEGRAKAKEEYDGKMVKITNILGSETYPDKVKNVALKVLRNEMTMETFEAALAMFDMSKESENSESAKDEQGEDTPPGGQELSTDGQIRNEADVLAYVASKKGGKQ